MFLNCAPGVVHVFRKFPHTGPKRQLLLYVLGLGSVGPTRFGCFKFLCGKAFTMMKKMSKKQNRKIYFSQHFAVLQSNFKIGENPQD